METQSIKLSIIIGVLNQFELSGVVIAQLAQLATRSQEVELIVIDNGSDELFSQYLYSQPDLRQAFESFGYSQVVRYEDNIGNYPIFKIASDFAKGDIMAFLHSDLVVYEDAWDDRLITSSEAYPEYGLMGFIGSTDLDNFGGRGSGTCSNFQGKTISWRPGLAPEALEGKVATQPEVKEWTGSPAEPHGRRLETFQPDASVVDGCAMIFKKEALQKIEVLNGFPLHHFYDRLMACQIIEAGYKVGVLGVACDHISGQTANQESLYIESARAWCKSHLGIDSIEEWVDLNRDWWGNDMNPSKGHQPNGWDHVIYLEAERQFLQLYRETKRMVPLVNGRKI
jgi:glycosyltransferase involved in cell wall biosynthesis